MAAEYHGVVKSGGLPIPGATVTASKLDKKLVTTTDDQGAYSLRDLEPGAWTVTVEMLGFATLTRTVDNVESTPVSEWSLQLLPPATANSETAGSPRPRRGPGPSRVEPPAAPPTRNGAPSSPANAAASATGQNYPRRQGNGPGRGGAPGQQTPFGNQPGYQQLGLNPSIEAGGLQGETTAGQENDFSPSGDLSQSASNAFVVNGSVSSGVTAPQQNDWMLFGPGGPGGFGPGGPVGPGGPGGPAGPGNFGVAGVAGAQGPGDGAVAVAPGGGPGGPGPGGFGGGPGGGFGGGGRGGFGGPGGRFGGPGRGGRGAIGRNANSFGNARRNRRSRFSGNLALILDNSAFDAKPFSLTGQETPKAAYNHFRTTGAFGGPLKIPKLISGEKTFFFLNYQVTRSRNGSVATGLVPIEAERNGTFPGLATISISPQAQALLNLYPLPNFSGSSRYNYQIPTVGIGNQSNVNARVSQTINSKNQLAGNFSWQNSRTTTPNLFGFTDATTMTGLNAGLMWTYHFSPTLFNNLRFNFSRSASQSTPYFANTRNVSLNAGILGNDQAPAFWGPPTLAFSNGISSLSDGNFALNHNNTTQVGDTLIWVRGKHTYFIGGDFRRLDLNQFTQQNPRGGFTFTGAFTGNAVADFLEGLPAASSVAYGNADKYFRTSWLDGYVNDDWRITNSLSLNMGIRWDFQQPIHELYNRLVNLSIGQNFTTATPVCATAVTGCTLSSQAGYPDSLIRPNYHELQPRIGIAWRPLPQHSTVVRAGYGLYYNTSVYQNLASQMAQQSPLSYSVTQPNSTANPFTIANAFLTPSINATPQTYAIDPNFRLGYLHYWQASVQQNLTSSVILTLTYQGNKGTRQVQEFLPNTYPAGSPASPYPAGYVYVTSNGNSNYNAASVQLQRRFRSGFSWNATYTFSKAIDDAQGIGGRGSLGSTYAQNWLDLSAERSLSSFNRTHTVSLVTQYTTGQGTAGGTLLNGWKGALLKDWTFAATLTAGSGLPETPVLLSRLATGTGVTGTVRPDYVGGSLSATLPDYGFNTAAFASPVSGQWGTAGRNIITGPFQFGLNASTSRVFRLGERRSFDLRVDATNVLNHVTFTSWDATLGTAQFGLPASANAMRSLQLNLRFRF